MSGDSSKSAAQEPSHWGVTSGFALAMVGLFGPQFFAGPLMPYVIGLLPVSMNVKHSLGRLVFDLLTILIIVTLVRLYGHGLEVIGLEKFKLKYLAAAVAGFGVYFLLVRTILEVALRHVPIDENEVQELGYAALGGWEMVLAFVALVIITPIAEEMVFRGFMFNGIRRRLPFWATAIIVSAVFGWVHGQWNVGIDVFALSLVLCGLREFTGSLWPAILLHSLKNGVAFYLLYLYNGG